MVVLFIIERNSGSGAYIGNPAVCNSVREPSELVFVFTVPADVFAGRGKARISVQFCEYGLLFAMVEVYKINVSERVAVPGGIELVSPVIGVHCQFSVSSIGETEPVLY